MKVGNYALKIMLQDLKIRFPKEEAAAIALHLVNAEKQAKELKKESQNDDIIKNIIKIIENEYEIEIDANSFNYSRFVSHMNYLIKRTKNNKMIRSENSAMFQNLMEEHTKTYRTVEKISGYFEHQTNFRLTDEEKLYLMLYINRLCSREECNQ